MNLKLLTFKSLSQKMPKCNVYKNIQTVTQVTVIGSSSHMLSVLLVRSGFGCCFSFSAVRHLG